MRVHTSSLLDFLQADGDAFCVPLFQRPYAWDSWQCQVLWRDILRAAESGRPHFFGALFFRRQDNRKGEPGRALIDGQQRVLTCLLLISALADRLQRTGETAGGMDAAALRETFLRSSDGAPKALPSQRDEQGFCAALLSREDGAAPCRALDNKALFAREMAAGECDAQALWEGLSRFQVVSIQLESGDDAQAIFESFNSKGVPLVSADMVRNYLLLSESPEEQQRLYEEYWEAIQGLFGDDPGSLRLDNALRAWTVIRCKTPRARTDAEAFDDFKQYFLNEYDGGKEDLMDELRGFCAVWAENYRYHAVKKFRSADWAKVGRKTLVSDRAPAAVDPESRAYYAKHYGVKKEERR